MILNDFLPPVTYELEVADFTRSLILLNFKTMPEIETDELIEESILAILTTTLFLIQEL